LHKLYEEALKVFMGKDKQTIAKLEDEISSLRNALQNAHHPEVGIKAVFGRKGTVDSPLTIFHLAHDNHGYLSIGVYLP
jgi:hypothetical protein